MRIAIFTLLAAIAIASANATTVSTAGRVLAATEAPESVSFAAVNQQASLNGLHAGEQVLAAVNDALGDAREVDGDQLLEISKRVAANDATLKTADVYTQQVVAAIRVALGQLFPGEEITSVLRRVLPSIPDPVATRRLQSELESIDFKDIGQGASFNGIKAGEQILEEVNKVTKNVDGDELLAVAQKVATNDKALATADATTKAIVAALKQVTAKLFPGEQLATVVNRLLPAITAAANAD